VAKSESILTADKITSLR